MHDCGLLLVVVYPENHMVSPDKDDKEIIRIISQVIGKVKKSQ